MAHIQTSRNPAPLPAWYAFDLPRLNPARSWENALSAAGQVPKTNAILQTQEKVLPIFDPSPVRARLLTFGRFRASRWVENYIAGYKVISAHPRRLAAVAEIYPDLPQDLGLPLPLQLISLVSCYMEWGEEHVMSVRWDKEGVRTVRGVQRRYGWNNHHYFLLESI